jgi:hypothetical protein
MPFVFPAFVTDFFAGLAAVALGVGFFWPSYLAARALLPGARPSTRLAGTAAVALWLSVAIFWPLGSFGLFRLPVVLVVLGGLVGIAHRRLAGATAAAELGGDLGAIRCELARAGRTVQVLAAVTTGFAGFGLLRGTLAPPLGWDSLTYHLLKAGRFVQAGGLVAERAPDSWAYYEYFPFVGDLYWAWAMLPGRSDLWLTTAGTAIWAAVLVGVYALARELDATPRGAALAALATGAMPATLAYLSSSYVDNTTLLLFLLGAIFVVRLVRGTGRLREAVLAAGALGLMVGTKLTTAAFFALGVALVADRVLRSGASLRTRALVLGVCLAAVLPGTPSYLRAWIEQGSPFYPFHVEIAGHTLSPGTEVNRHLNELLQGDERGRLTSPAQFWAKFLWEPSGRGYFVNPGPGAPVLVLVAFAALPALIRDRSRRSAAVFLAVCGVLLLLGFLSSNMESFRVTIKAATAGRYITIGLGCAAGLAGTCRGRWAPGTLAVATAAGLTAAWPRGFRGIETNGLTGLLGVVLVVAVSSWVLLRWRRGQRNLELGLIAILIALGVAGAEFLRSRWRYPLWEAAASAKTPLFHMHPLHAGYGAAWPIWQTFDDGVPHRLAVTAGWDGLGHNWYRQPLLGSRLQNLVLYVPLTADGSVVDYFNDQEVAKRADFDAWVERLNSAGVDHVVSLAPRRTIEDFWMTSSPQLFEKAIETAGGRHVAFRFRRESLPGTPPRR